MILRFKSNRELVGRLLVVISSVALIVVAYLATQQTNVLFALLIVIGMVWSMNNYPGDSLARGLVALICCIALGIIVMVSREPNTLFALLGVWALMHNLA